MSRLVAICIAITLGAAIGITALNPFGMKTQSTASTLSTPTPIPQVSALLPGSPYAVASQRITPATLRLLANFEEEETTSDILEKNGCRYGANGGFYTTEQKPLGLFITEGKRHGESTISSAANAYLVRRGDSLAIEQAPPVGSVTFALQTGPYFLPAVTPAITNDEHARRILIAQTEKQEWYFVAFTHPENAYEGPLLAEIPELLQKMPQGFVEALNLDGGTASAFYSEGGVRFGELKSVGSFLCGST